MTGKHIPALLATSAEFTKMKVRNKEELAILQRIKGNDAVKDYIKPNVQVKPVCLLVGYMFDLLKEDDFKNEGIKQDLENILKGFPSYMDIMLQQTLMLSQLGRMGRSPKKITAKNVMTQIQFSQNLMQLGYVNKDPFMQLPGFGADECAQAKKVTNGKGFFAYCRLPKEDRRGFADSVFGKENAAAKFEEQEKVIEALPLVKLTMTAFVEGEDEIVVGDILTCKLEVKYFNLEKGQKSGYVHSMQYPYLKRDGWYLLITDDTFTSLASIEKISVTDDLYVKEFKERVRRPGKISFTAVLTNDSYKGLDQFSKVEVDVIAESKNRVEF